MSMLSTNNKLAVIGARESVMVFQVVGMEVRYALDAHQAERALHKLAREGYCAIYITEKLFAQIQEAVGIYKSSAFPAIIPIPDKNGSDGLGMAGVRKNVEKAIGADILFGEGR